jgi:quercetin dioxygenase-like cupin family protein
MFQKHHAGSRFRGGSDEHSSGTPPPRSRFTTGTSGLIAGDDPPNPVRVQGFQPALPRQGRGADFVDKLQDKPDHVVIAQFPKGWVGAWHENPAPQWIIPLSGRWFVETMDGHRIEIPGDASLGEDQGSKPDAAGHVGHLSGTLGDAPITLMFVQLDHKVTLNDACRDN